MPANTKFLTHSKWQKFAKITAGFLGGFLVSMAMHIALAAWVNRPAVIITSSFSSFLLWAGLMIMAFLAKNGWKVWGTYLLITFLFSAIAYYGKSIYPMIN